MLLDSEFYSGWQVRREHDGWRVSDTGTLAASLALMGYSVTPSCAGRGLTSVAPGQWAWDPHVEVISANIPGGSQEELAKVIGLTAEGFIGAAVSDGKPSNPLVADSMAVKILSATASPLRESAWEHLFPGIPFGHSAFVGITGGLAALLAGDAAQAIAQWRPWFDSVGLKPFDRILQAVYKVDTEYALGGVAAAAAHQLWSLSPQDAVFGAPLAELLLYFGRNDSLGRLFSLYSPDALAAARRSLEALSAPIPAPQCRVSVLVITWNRAALLDQTLQALKASLALPDTEIVVGINGCTDDTEAVLARHGIQPALRSPENIGIDLYRQLFPLAKGQVLLEIDDDVTSFPGGVDALLWEHFQAFPDYGALSILPWVRQLHGKSLPAQGLVLGQDSHRGMQVNQGSMWGCCLAVRREDFFAGNGFYGATLSKRLGEEDQIMRKLYMRQRKFGFIDCGGLEILP